jgi:hypothetical protein
MFECRHISGPLRADDDQEENVHFDGSRVPNRTGCFRPSCAIQQCTYSDHPVVVNDHSEADVDL